MRETRARTSFFFTSGNAPAGFCCTNGNCYNVEHDEDEELSPTLPAGASESSAAFFALGLLASLRFGAAAAAAAPSEAGSASIDAAAAAARRGEVAGEAAFAGFFAGAGSAAAAGSLALDAEAAGALG